jgi:hypothetical protein
LDLFQKCEDRSVVPPVPVLRAGWLRGRIDMTIFIDAPNKLRIDQCWIFVSADEDGNEGACAATMPPFGLVPLIACDDARLESLRPMAKKIAGMTGKTIKLIRLTTLEDLEIIEP